MILVAERVGLIRLRRRATRVCQCGTGLMCRAGRAFASLPVRNWAYVPSWSGFCEFASAELGLCAELVGLLRVCQCGTGLMCRAGRAFASLPVVAWGGEMVKRLTKAHQKMNASRDQFNKAMGQHAEVLARLEELETLRSREQEAAAAQREALEAQVVAEREAHEAEKAAREMLEAELEEIKSQAARDAERLKLEGKEEFLKSPEFDTLLGRKAGGFFKNGFFGCVAQWRANGYPEEEHPASFLDVQQAIAEMPDEDEAQEEEEEGEDEDEGGIGPEATSPSPPLS
ncbi:hypothetical protein F511_18481 [Dorcoceras hygrometricum]|uniref:Uncharacterized protein n=1 Tax=Dorcoceras hygrometricum TaxID=472368 RepID=A0A2Z7DFK7_9LAMI|nr:hypothetical protein F511_18481 [Dorcoceras hygrometricum]